MKHFLLYTGARLGLLVVVGGLAFAVGMRGFLLILVAFLGSGVLSFFVLRGPRAQFGSDVGGFFSRINDRIDEATRKEDAALDDAPHTVDTTIDGATHDTTRKPEDTPARSDAAPNDAAPSQDASASLHVRPATEDDPSKTGT